MEKYRQNRTWTDAGTIDQLQARVIFSKDMMLNPKSGIIIFRYTTDSQRTLKHYTKKIKAITHAIVQDWLKREPRNQLHGTRLGKLYRFIDQPKPEPPRNIIPPVKPKKHFKFPPFAP